MSTRVDSVASAACESRGFFVVDALSPGCLTWTRQALLQLGHMLAVALKRPPPIGVAVLQRKGPKQSAQLQVLLRPGGQFQLKEYTSCIRRVTAASPTDAADGKTLGVAVKALIEHMLMLPGGQTCHNHVFIISSRFSPHPNLQKVIQICCQQLRASLHFLQLAGPEAGPQQQAGLNAGNDVQQQQDAAGLADSAAFELCIQGFAPKATFDSFMADCEAVVDLLCQTWLRVLMAGGSSNNNSSRGQPDLILQLGQQLLHCNLQQHIMQLDPFLLPAQLCPCHNVPMQPPTGSAAALQAQQAAASDAATAAALLLLPEGTPWRCAVSGQGMMQAPSISCRTDSSIVQLGRHTQLRVGSGSSSINPAAEACSSSSSNRLPVALALPPNQPCQLQVKHVVRLQQIDSMMLYGMPMVATPAASAAACTATALGDDATAATADDAAMLMRAVCHLLLEQQQVLLASSSHDLVRRCCLPPPLQAWYMLQPAADGASLLLRSIACKEQLLPPKGFAGMVQLEEQVVLLDADQLEAVRGSLAGLVAGGSSSNGDGSSSGAGLQHDAAAAAADMLCCNPSKKNDDSAEALDWPPAAAGNAAPAATASAVAALPDSSYLLAAEQDDGSSSSMPLLSCGLHAWVASILDSSTGTYTAPAMPPAAACAPPQQQGTAGMQQHQQQHGLAPQLPTAPAAAGQGAFVGCQPAAHTAGWAGNGYPGAGWQQQQQQQLGQPGNGAGGYHHHHHHDERLTVPGGMQSGDPGGVDGKGHTLAAAAAAAAVAGGTTSSRRRASTQAAAGGGGGGGAAPAAPGAGASGGGAAGRRPGTVSTRSALRLSSSNSCRP